MKLKGSITEDRYREQLESSRTSLFNDPSCQQLLDALRSHARDLRTAYVLACPPEQGEEIYTVLVDADTILIVELDRTSSAPPIVSSVSVADYERGGGRPRRLKLAVARQMAEADLKATPVR